MSQEKGRNQWKSHEFLNFDDIIHKTGLHLTWLDSRDLEWTPAGICI